MSRTIGNDIDAFRTSANVTILQCKEQTIRITEPGFEPDLQEGEFLVVLNLYKMQSNSIERLTAEMSDEEACTYVRDETNKVLVDMSQNGSLEVGYRKGPFGQLIPSVEVDRVLCLHPENGSRRRFIGIARGTIATL